MTDSIFERNLTTKDLEVFAPSDTLFEGEEFLSLPKAKIPKMAEEYVSLMETEQSDKWCKCTWQIHPDDVNVKEGHCRKCNGPRENEAHSEGHEYFHPFVGKRKRRSDENPQCPVHTRAGFILGFFEWLFSDEMAEMRD